MSLTTNLKRAADRPRGRRREPSATGPAGPDGGRDRHLATRIAPSRRPTRDVIEARAGAATDEASLDSIHFGTFALRRYDAPCPPTKRGAPLLPDGLDFAETMAGRVIAADPRPVSRLTPGVHAGIAKPA